MIGDYLVLTKISSLEGEVKVREFYRFFSLILVFSLREKGFVSLVFSISSALIAGFLVVLERQIICRVGLITRHMPALALDEAGDGCGKPWVGNPVARRRNHRFETAGDFVFALRAGVESQQAVFDAISDALVVTGFEVQRIVVFGAAPIAAVQRVAADEK